MLMKAVRIHEYGSPSVLRYEDGPLPKPGEDEVLIRVHATAVNPLDCWIRSGSAVEWFPHSFPLILGFDVAGVVAAIGAKVYAFAVGDEVYGSPDTGGYAEYVAVPSTRVARKPQSLDFIHAAAMPVSALTAWQVIKDVAQLQRGQAVLIHGAAGGVGSFAVQIAQRCGAHVIGTASRHNHPFLRQLGVDEVIDYNTTRFESVVHGVDLVLDTVGGDTLQRSGAVLKPGGFLISIVESPAAELGATYGVRQQQVSVQINSPQLTDLAARVDAGQLTPIVSTVLPLQQAGQAHVQSEGRHVRGKVVLQVVA
jgi:NADPH:quinone reductase-like Zn-dependent oxidoreductase